MGLYTSEGQVEKIDEIVEQSLLYDFYGELLTGNQRRIYEAVVFSDLTISEAAEQEGVTRQGIFDMLRRSEKALARYEEKLGLVKRFTSTRKSIRLIKEYIDSSKSGQLTEAEALGRIEDTVKELEEAL